MNVQLLKALFFQGLGRCFIENQGAFMLAPELLFVSGPLILLQLQGQPWHLPIHPLHQGRLSGRSGAGRNSAADQVCQPL